MKREKSKLTGEMKKELKANSCPHDLIEEFEFFLTPREIRLPVTGLTIVVLSAPHYEEKIDGKTLFIEKTPENMARIDFATYIATGIPESYLVLDGEEQQLYMMYRTVTHDLSFPEKKIVLLDSGHRGESNTVTQFAALSRMIKESFYQDQDSDVQSLPKDIVIVSTDYHGPRVIRTALKYFGKKTKFCFLGTPLVKYNVMEKIKNEISRICAYSEKGDIVRNLPKDREYYTGL